jgi:hypothetical protein
MSNCHSTWFARVTGCQYVDLASSLPVGLDSLPQCSFLTSGCAIAWATCSRGDQCALSEDEGRQPAYLWTVLLEELQQFVCVGPQQTHTSAHTMAGQNRLSQPITQRAPSPLLVC